MKCFKVAQNYRAKRSLTACSEVTNDIKWKVEYIKHTVCKINARMWYISVLLCCFCFSRYRQWYKKTKKAKFTLGPSLIYSSFQTHWLVTTSRVSCVRRSKRPEDSFTLCPRRKTNSPPAAPDWPRYTRPLMFIANGLCPPLVQLPTCLLDPFNYSAEN